MPFNVTSLSKTSKSCCSRHDALIITLAMSRRDALAHSLHLTVQTRWPGRLSTSPSLPPPFGDALGARISWLTLRLVFIIKGLFRSLSRCLQTSPPLPLRRPRPRDADFSPIIQRRRLGLTQSLKSPRRCCFGSLARARIAQTKKVHATFSCGIAYPERMRAVRYWRPPSPLLTFIHHPGQPYTGIRFGSRPSHRTPRCVCSGW